MVLPVSDSRSISSGQKRKLKKKQRKQKNRKERRLGSRASGGNPGMSAMSAWAENFTSAATWQLKQQVAYWKAKAVALQYENSVLHEIIQKNHIVLPTTSAINNDIKRGIDLESTSRHDKSEDLEAEEDDTDCTKSESDDDDQQIINDGDDLEVSTEFVEFLAANAKYREDARRERERLNAAYEETYVKVTQESIEEKIARKEELYGDKYQKIVALEMFQMSNFKVVVDKLQPEYWPNIPLNL